ncbi:hypothetical protein GCM10027425_09200 [Alteromonas gracilis]
MTRAPAAPRFATPRTPGRPSYGAAVAQVAVALGKPLQAWQRQVVDVATELIPDPAGTILMGGQRYSWAYRTVVIHVQRQAGKTTLLGPKNLHRCLVTRGAKLWLTAQSRQDARDVWRDVAELVRTSPLAGLFTPRKSNGSEELASTATGSTFRVFAPTEEALHGKANESVDVDEVWAFDGAEGDALQQAILPTFSTTGGQLWLTSTAGTAASTWLLRYVERGRAAVTAGTTTGIAYFEWSLTASEAAQVTETLSEIKRAGGDTTPELAAALDAAVDLVLSRHPGEYVRRDVVREAALSDTPAGFLRAYGNVWSLTADRTIPDHLWRAGRRTLDQPEAGDLALAYDVDPHSATASVGFAWKPEPGQVAVDVADHRPGTGWLVARIEQLAQRYGCKQVWFDQAGPALDIADELRRRGIVEPVGLPTADAKAACSAYISRLDVGQLQHRGAAVLDESAAGAVPRELGDGWLWDRRKSAGSVGPIASTTWAAWGLDHKPPAPPAPMLVTTADRPRSRSLTA